MNFMSIEEILEWIKNVIGSPKFHQPIIYIAIGITLNYISKKLIGKIKSQGNNAKDKRKATVINLLKSIIKYFILIFVVLGILKAYGVDTTSIIASLGIFAAVIGLAFQDILKDFLAGITIIFDNKYAVGDTVDIKGFKGVVTSLGLRTTKIKSATGEVRCIGNASFTELTNYNLAIEDLFIKINVDYDTNIDKLEKILESMREDILITKDVKDYKLLGLDGIGTTTITYIVDITCKATAGPEIKRQALKLLKEKFDKEKIKISVL